MTKRRTLLNTIAILTFSGVLMAQMDMPASTPGNKSKVSSAAPATLTGIVSDAMCGAHHMAKDKSAAECTRECVKQGTKYHSNSEYGMAVTLLASGIFAERALP